MMDSFEELSEEEIRKRYELVYSQISEWANLTREDLCHYHPERLEAIAEIMGIKIPPRILCSRKKFEIGCKNYQNKIYGNK